MTVDELGRKKLTCPLCRQLAAFDVMRNTVQCQCCGVYFVDPVIRFAAEEGRSLPVLRPHLLSGYTRERHELQLEPPLLINLGAPIGLCFQGAESRFPQSVVEKGSRLLAAVFRRTQHFGHRIKLDSKIDYPLAYAVNGDEFRELLQYLEQRGFLDVQRTQYDQSPKLTAEGFAAVESQTLLPPVSVFISSTCYDLIDLRSEIAESLSSQGYT